LYFTGGKKRVVSRKKKEKRRLSKKKADERKRRKRALSNQPQGGYQEGKKGGWEEVLGWREGEKAFQYALSREREQAFVALGGGGGSGDRSHVGEKKSPPNQAEGDGLPDQKKGEGIFSRRVI